MSSTTQTVKWYDKALGQVSKLGAQRHLSAIRDAFAIFTPLLIAGAVGVVMLTFVFGGWGTAEMSILGWIASAAGGIDSSSGSWAFTGDWAVASSIGVSMFSPLWGATVGLISVYLAFGLGYFLAKSRNSDDALIAGFVGLASFFIAVTASTWYFDAKGLLIAIISSFAGTEIYLLLAKSPKMVVHMPAGVPPAVSRAFAKLFPIMIVFVGWAIVQLPFILVGTLTHVTANLASNTAPGAGWDAHELNSLAAFVYFGAQAPFMSAAQTTGGSLGLAIAYVMLISFFWFFGLHGTNIVNGVFNTIWLGLLATSNEMLANGQESHLAFVQGSFDAFVFIGGWGCTLSLLIATLLFGRVKAQREISKFSLPSGIFQINEPVTFGYPLVLNITLLLPLLIIMPVLVVTTWLFIQVFEWVPVVRVAIPWTSPVIVGAALATLSWQGPLLALMNFIISILMYIPFVLYANKHAHKTGEELIETSLAQNIKSMFTREKKTVKNGRGGK